MKRPAMRMEPRAPTRPLTDKAGEVRELTKEDMPLFRPIAEVDPGMVKAMSEFSRKVGRPKAVAPKVHVGFRLAADVVASIKASGRGYNARVEQILRKAGFGRKEGREPSLNKAAAKKFDAAESRTAKRSAKRRA